MSRLQFRLRLVLVTILVLLSPALGYAAYQHVTGNLHVLEDGMLYRSGQLDGPALTKLVLDKNIRTIINLRGAHPDTNWYAAETSVADGYGVRYIPISLSSAEEPDMATMLALANAERNAPGPMLVHCRSGADRTGLAAAIYELVVAGSSKEAAAGQLSPFYGHFPWFGSRTAAMDRAFAKFAEYWDASGRRAVAFGDREMLAAK
ncbi:MAG: protein tyrosine phosphatase [Alphaproteobacteria bacterium]|nr:MAG: protein tyrosine phosphatase [Alphaproteobacteria bacterium]